MDTDLIKREINDIISKPDGIRNSINMLKKILKDEASIKTELIVLESQYTLTSQNERTGVRGNDEIRISYSRLVSSLLSLSKEITKKDINIYNEWGEGGSNVQIKLLIEENTNLRSELEQQNLLFKKFKELKMNSIDPYELADFSISEYWNGVLDENWKSIFRKHFPPNRSNVKFVDIKKWLFDIRLLRVCNSNLLTLDPIKVLKKLETLEIIDCKKINKLDSISELPNLTTLNISRSHITSFKPIGLNKKISILKLVNVESTGLNLSDIVGLENLITIEIDQYKDKIIHNIAALGEIKSLKEIHIKNKMLTYEDKQIIVKKLPYVRINTFD